MRLAWPLILSNSCWTLQIVLDRVLLSRSSGEAVGAGISGAVLFWTPLCLLQYTANYATTFVAQYTGAGRPHRVGPVVGQALWFAVLSGLAFLLLIPVAGPLVALGGHTPHLQELETTYLRILCLSGLPTLITAAGCSFFAGRGDSRAVLLVNATGLCINGLCAYLLIFGQLGLPEMGIAGAGWAAVVGTSSSAVLVLCLLLRKRYREEFGNGAGWGFDRALFGRLMKFGLPNGIGAALDGVAWGCFLLLVGRLGEVELAVTSIVATLNLIAILPMFGVAQAVEVLMGQRLGEDRPDLAARSTWTGLGITAGFTVVVALAYVCIPELLARPFQSQHGTVSWEDVRLQVPILLNFVAVYCLFDCANLIFSFALRGAGDTRFVTVVALVLAWPVMILPTWASWAYGWGLNWAWAAASAYVIALALVFLARFLQGHWRMMRVIERVSLDLEAAQTLPPPADDAVTARDEVQPAAPAV
jgi:MATE family multidrug resistance protein